MDLPANWVAFELPLDPDPDLLPRYGTPDQLARLHERYWGKASPTAIRRWPLPWVKRNGRVVTAIAPFLAEAARRFEDRPLPSIVEAMRRQLTRPDR